MKLKRTKHDDVFSKCIRERDDWSCQVCGKSYPENAQGLHCSHFFSRRHQSTRYDPDNACAKCFACHQKMGGDPVIFARWVRRYLGETRFRELHDRHNKIMKRTKADLEELYQHYKSELARMKSERSEGKTGVLHLVSYE